MWIWKWVLLLTPRFSSLLERQVLLTVEEMVANASQLDFLSLESDRTVERFFHTLCCCLPQLFDKSLLMDNLSLQNYLWSITQKNTLFFKSRNVLKWNEMHFLYDSYDTIFFLWLWVLWPLSCPLCGTEITWIYLQMQVMQMHAVFHVQHLCSFMQIFILLFL